MLRPLRSYRFTVVLMLGLAAGTDVLVARYAVGAMACCAKTQHTCAGVKSADDCCRSMGQGLGASATRLSDISPYAVALAVLPAHAPLALRPTASGAVADAPFKRPHDPPHLHPIPLLI